MLNNGYVRLADDAEDYTRLGIDRRTIEPWEDGLRMPTGRGTYEWWYFDAHLDNGTMIVVGFYTKPPFRPVRLLSPLIMINITTPDGNSIDKSLSAAPEAFAASKERCDVRIGENRFEGDLNRHHITATIDDVSVDIELVNEVPAWRPRSGHMYFGHDGFREKLFAWLPSVPQGKVNMTYSIGGKTFSSTGTGYHDHNWGDTSMKALMHDWYWSRAKIGPYTVIAAYITAAKQYDYQPQVVFLLAKDGVIVGDDETRVRFSAGDVFTDAKTGKPVADVRRYIYRDGNTEYVVTFKRERTILRKIFADALPPVRRAIARLAGLDSAYLRFSGMATIEKRQDGQTVEQYRDPALWELMYFGHSRPLDL